MQERQVVIPEAPQITHPTGLGLARVKRVRAVRTGPKVKALRRKLAALRPKPVPDTGVIYERVNPNGSKRRYKVQPNGEWRRVKD